MRLTGSSPSPSPPQAPRLTLPTTASNMYTTWLVRGPVFMGTFYRAGPGLSRDFAPHQDAIQDDLRFELHVNCAHARKAQCAIEVLRVEARVTLKGAYVRVTG